MNGLVPGGLILMLGGALIALFRKIPENIFNFVREQFLVQVTVNSSDPLFDYIATWLSDHSYTARARRVEANINNSIVTVEEGIKETKIWFSPGFGVHFFKFRGKLIWLSRNEKPKGENQSSRGVRPTETFYLRTIGRNQSIVRSMLKEVVNTVDSKSKSGTSIYVPYWGYWRKLCTAPSRPFDSVILNEGEKEFIYDDMKNFINSEDWYIKMGIPYHRGYLFYGLAGTGKSSIVSALAAILNRDLYVLNLSGSLVDDDGLNNLMVNLPRNSLLLMEDIDAAVNARESVDSDNMHGEQGKQQEELDEYESNNPNKEEKKRVSLSALLNVLDGACAKHGSMVIMTTNYIDKLDKALIRPGRVDFKMEFGCASAYQAEELFKRFYPEAPAKFAKDFGQVAFSSGKSMAELQQLCLYNRDSYIKVIGALEASHSKSVSA